MKTTRRGFLGGVFGAVATGAVVKVAAEPTAFVETGWIKHKAKHAKTFDPRADHIAAAKRFKEWSDDGKHWHKAPFIASDPVEERWYGLQAHKLRRPDFPRLESGEAIRMRLEAEQRVVPWDAEIHGNHPRCSEHALEGFTPAFRISVVQEWLEEGLIRETEARRLLFNG